MPPLAYAVIVGVFLLCVLALRETANQLDNARLGSGVPHSVHTSDSPIGYAHFGHNPRRTRTHRRTTNGNHKIAA